MGKDCPRWVTWGGYGLSAVMYFLGVWIVNTFEGDPYHGEAYLESIYNVADGIPYEELTTGIYGHYGLFFLLPMKIFGAKAVVIQFLIALVGVVTDLAMLYCIHHLIKKNWVRLLMALVVPVIPFAYRRTNYWQLQPHRLVFPMLLAAYMLFCLRKKQSKKRLGSGAAGFCVCWQCCGAPRAVCSVSSAGARAASSAGGSRSHGTPAASGNAMVRCCWVLCWRCWGH